MGLSLRWDFTQLRGVGRTYSCNTRIVCQLERAYIFSALEKKKEQSMSCQQKKRDKRNIGSRMASYYRRRWVMPLEGREPHMAISKKETCPIHRDWHDEENDFKEKSVRYTEIRHTISHMRSRMRESRTSGSVEGRILWKVCLLDPAKKYKLYKSSINKSIHFAQRSLSSSTRGQRVTAQLNLSREWKNRMTTVVISAILNPVSRVSIPY